MGSKSIVTSNYMRLINRKSPINPFLVKHLMTNCDYCDFEFRIGDQHFPVHKIIIKETFGSHFMAVINSLRDGQLTLNCTKTEALMVILQYTYLGEVQVNCEDVDLICQVIRLAIDFGINDLQQELNGKLIQMFQGKCQETFYKCCFNGNCKLFFV